MSTGNERVEGLFNCVEYSHRYCVMSQVRGLNAEAVLLSDVYIKYLC